MCADKDVQVQAELEGVFGGLKVPECMKGRRKGRTDRVQAAGSRDSVQGTVTCGGTVHSKL
jgi:hypothetical protein